MDRNKELALLFTHFAELIKEGKVFCKMFQMSFGTVFHLKHFREASKQYPTAPHAHVRGVPHPESESQTFQSIQSDDRV
jgi:hypothetical protein